MRSSDLALTAATGHFGGSGWPVSLVCGAGGESYLEARPWPDDARTVRVWAENDVFFGQLRQADRIQPLEDYLDPERQAAMVRGVLGLLDGADEGLVGFAGGSLATVLGHDEAYWRRAYGVGSQLHRDLVARVSKQTERGELLIDDEGWIHCQSSTTVSSDGLSFAAFSGVLGDVLAIFEAYRLALRLAMFGGWSEAREVIRP